MLQHPEDKATLVELTDQAFRAKTSARVADQFIHILDVQGIPRFFSRLDRAMLRGFQVFGDWLPQISVPMVKEHMQHETANVILPAEPELLREHLTHRREQGIRMNVNFLGEALLSEEEVARRFDRYLEALRDEDTEVFSIKISTLYSQMSALARDATIALLCDRLERLYQAALQQTFQRHDGTRVSKFIYLDMEEYRDLSLTCEVFMRTLERKGLEQAAAGLALQAYLPDSFLWQQRLNEWARQRLDLGGSRITLRLVKGANMEMERCEASIRGWPQAPFEMKVETDANYKRMMLEGFQPENLKAVKLGIASHNLFDVSYALILTQQNAAFEQVQFEMLEGMANHQRRALFEQTKNLLLYAPVCDQEQFLSAIGYLIRRLDENTGEDNFLRHAFHLDPGSDEWRKLEGGFLQAFEVMPNLRSQPRRTQDRRLPIAPNSGHQAASHWSEFQNEPDTDWSLPHHAAWAKEIIERREKCCGDTNGVLPIVVNGKECTAGRAVKECRDPSRPGQIVRRTALANSQDINDAVNCAAKDEDGWRALSATERESILLRVADELRRARADLMGAALANTGKTLMESDPEVSEAIGFVVFYAAVAKELMEGLSPNVRGRGKGVVAVISPWNFPLAIPCGGIAAALAAGNTVLFKPASDALLPAWEICQCFWRAGVSRKTLQFLPCPGGNEGRQLVQHPGVDAVILTGGTETARAMLKAKPGLSLSAETGGKNATIITALADRDLAIKNVLHSAFSHSGQKCSATSLLLLEAEVYDDPEFRRALAEATTSLITGSAWHLPSKTGPLIRPPEGELKWALTELDPGEQWLVQPRCLEGNPHLWTPGIKWDVAPGSRTHLTEFFGPVLGVMRYETLSEAIELVNQTGFGLTSGLESLDDREQALWKEGIRAGNLYINRSTVGAVVLRQPFGGVGKSSYGPGLKAGGPHYISQFMTFRETLPSQPTTPSPHSRLAVLLQTLKGYDTLNLTENTRLTAACASYEKAWEEEFGLTHDTFRLVGQDNLRRYLPTRRLCIRLHADDSLFDIYGRVAAAQVAGCETTLSLPYGMESAALRRLREAGMRLIEEDDSELADQVRHHRVDRIRYAGPHRVEEKVREAAAEAFLYIADEPVRMEGRLELLHYLQEQSISHDYHRYGNLGSRAGEVRAPLARASPE